MEKLLKHFSFEEQILTLISSLMLLSYFIFGPFSEGAQILLLTLGVLIIGMPHGAFDIFHLWRLGNHRFSRFLLMVTGYLFLALAIFGLWTLYPILIFLGLLLLAWAHFGMSERSEALSAKLMPLDVFIRGLMVLILPLLFFQSDLARYFGYMTFWSQEHYMAIFSLLPRSIYYSAAGLWLIWSFYLLKRDPSGAVRLLLPGLGFILTPPLFAFTLYFCLWHSWPHFREEWEDIKGTSVLPSGQLLLITAAVTVITGIGLIFISYLTDQGALDSSILRMIFLGLLCLTVPHMLLSQILRH